MRAGSADGAARVARAHHRDHVQLQTGRTPLRDYAVMALVVLVVAAVLRRSPSSRSTRPAGTRRTSPTSRSLLGG